MQLPDRSALIDRLEALLDAAGTTRATGPSDRSGIRAPAIFVVQVEGYEGLAAEAREVLEREVVRRLDRLVRSTDVVGRLAADRYVLVADALAPESAGAVAERLRSAFAMPLSLERQLVSLPVRIAVEHPAGRRGRRVRAEDLLAGAEAQLERREGR